MARPPQKKESLLVKTLERVFIGLPLALAHGILGLVAKARKRMLKCLMLGSFLLLSFLLILGSRRLFRFVSIYFDIGAGVFGWSLGLKFGFFYLGYLLILLPLFLLLAYFGMEGAGGFFKKESAKKEPEILRMRMNRLSSSFKKVYLGQSFRTGKSVWLTNAQRLMHTEVVGSTGTGKTESVLLPVLGHDIAHGKGAVVIDGKGDLELLDRILHIVDKKKRRDDFYFFSLTHPGKSNTYNPLLRGNATELKDKIIGSMPWSEEFYRRMAEQASLTVLNALVQRGQKVKFGDLHTYLTDVTALSALADSTKDGALQKDLGKMVEQFKSSSKFLSGLMADLYLTARSEFSSLVDVDEPDIDLLDAYLNNKIVYFQLDLQGYGDTAKRMGRMILQDIRTVSSHIQSHIPNSKRHFFPVFVDDAASFLDVNFIEFLNKARASSYAIMLLHQSLGDLVIRRDFSFQQQVIENTNIKIIFRQDDPQSVEKFTRIGGTRKTTISTYQTEEKFLGKGFTGAGSIREGQTFRVEPDLIRGLKRGEAVVIWKSPFLYTDYIKLDFFGHPAFPTTLERTSKKKVKHEEKKGLAQAEVKSLSEHKETTGEKSEKTNPPPADVEDPLARIHALSEKARRLR